MDFLSDESTLLDSDSYSIFPPLPPGNYVWKSPHGEALTGRHHQLILHLLSRDDTWRDNPDKEFRVIRSWLRDYYPTHKQSITTIGAIAEEYLKLSPDDKVMYQVTTAFTVTSATDLPDSRDQGSLGQQTNTILPFVNELQGFYDLPEVMSSTNTFDQYYFQSTTEPTIFDSGTYSAMNSQNQDISYAPRKSANSPSVSDGVEMTEENAAIYAPLYLRALADMRRIATDSQEPVNAKTAIEPPQDFEAGYSRPNSAPLDNHADKDVQYCSAASVEVTPALPPISLPDPTKYVQTSKNHWRIPSSEADKFVAHFQPGVDSVPHKIDGYFWYCQKCYDPSTDRQASIRYADKSKKSKIMIVRGKFSSKRSVEKHYTDIHKTSWKCEVLPEPERVFGTVLNTGSPEIETDIEKQETDSSTSYSSKAAFVVEEDEAEHDEEQDISDSESEDGLWSDDTLDEEDSSSDSNSEDGMLPDFPSSSIIPPAGGRGKQKAWEDTPFKRRTRRRRLSNPQVTFAEKKEVREFDEDDYSDLSPVDTFYPEVEPEPDVPLADPEAEPKRLKLILKMPVSR